MNALLQHLLLTIRLNFRSKQALIYGYLVPLFFLVAYGSVFRGGQPPMVHQIGQLIVITVLGGACFGMPTTMVNERERGLWRRYRLLPTATAGLIVSAMAARFILVFTSAFLQVVLSIIFYHMPVPALPAQLVVAFAFVCFAFLGMGLIIAMLADTVPAVQALGQALFLPMIMIGGVGVPLVALPAWAQTIAGFLPGRYAVELLQACVLPGKHGLVDGKFALAALTVIGAAACVAGAKLFRWDAGQKIPGKSKVWVLFALAAWLAVGIAAWHAGRLQVTPSDSPMATEKWRGVTDAQLAGITYNDLPDDDSSVIPFAHDFSNAGSENKQRLDTLRVKLAQWPPGNGDDLGQRVRNYLCVCAIFDIARDRNEAEVPLLVLDQFKQMAPTADLKHALGWAILHPTEGTVVTSVHELGMEDKIDEPEIRERCALYAKKFLLRLK